jgi:hypothetical protein
MAITRSSSCPHYHRDLDMFDLEAQAYFPVGAKINQIVKEVHCHCIKSESGIKEEKAKFITNTWYCHPLLKYPAITLLAVGTVTGIVLIAANNLPKA